LLQVPQVSARHPECFARGKNSGRPAFSAKAGSRPAFFLSAPKGGKSPSSQNPPEFGAHFSAILYISDHYYPKLKKLKKPENLIFL
jgi:hypothetical protein